MKEIVPVKLIVEINEDGTFKHSILLYKFKEDDVVQNRFYTMTVNTGITITDIQKIISDSKGHVEKGEKIAEINLPEEEVKIEKSNIDAEKLKNELASIAKLKFIKKGENL